MSFEIKVLNFEKDCQGFKLGKADIKIIESEEKYIKIRNVAVFLKDEKKWISFPKTKREDKWVDIIEFFPPLPSYIHTKILTALETFI